MYVYVCVWAGVCTGKTTTIAALVAALVARGSKVLLTSFTNNAVDNMLIKLKAGGCKCTCTYVCIYIYIHMYIHVYIYIYTYIYMYIYTYSYMYTHIYIYINVCFSGSLCTQLGLFWHITMVDVIFLVELSSCVNPSFFLQVSFHIDPLHLTCLSCSNMHACRHSESRHSHRFQKRLACAPAVARSGSRIADSRISIHRCSESRNSHRC